MSAALRIEQLDEPPQTDPSRDSFPAAWSEILETPFGTFDLGWVGYAHAVDDQAPHFPATWPRSQKSWRTMERWLKVAAFPRSKSTRGGHTKAPLARSERKLISRARQEQAEDQRADITRAPWEDAQDVAAFQSWRDQLPLSRNVPGPAKLSPEVHIAATLVDGISLDQAELHLDTWDREAMYRDRSWLAAVYQLSPRQAKAMSLYLSGLNQEAIASRLGVKTSTANEHLDRARRRMREVCGLSPAITPLSMRADCAEKIGGQ